LIVIIQLKIIKMGNCSGFCMSAASEESQVKKVTQDRVQNALYEKDELIKDNVNYEDAYMNQNGNSGN
jgi:hypothetical protein